LIRANLTSFRGRDRAYGPYRWLHQECPRGRCGGVHGGCADPRVELVFRRLHVRTV